MSRFDSESLNAPHTQRHLDEIPQRGPTAEKMAESALARAGLVKRLRMREAAVTAKLKPSKFDTYDTSLDAEAASRIEQLERYLRLEQNNNVKISREIERINTELAAEKALADRRLELLKWAHETLVEINPSNYDHDEVCRINDASVDVILGIAPEIGETHGKTPEWWAAHRKARGL